MVVRITVRTKPPDFAKKISEAPRLARGRMTEAAAKFLIGVGSGAGALGSASRGLRHYPSVPAGSKYKRTGDLRAGWKADPQLTRTKIKNDVLYAKYVQGDNTQAWMHKGRWRTVSVVAMDNIKGMLRAAELALDKYLKEKGL